ncbi:MAG: amidohydrolase, partial [Syntrophomonadaceae bacterium]|nr:amidohydrolase [Syntrophomonadaceae bacterium]
CGMEVKRVAKTGVVGLLRGKETGKTILLRADMDALPVEELNDVPYKSKNQGKMHACGHDGHMAMLLGAAKVLSTHKNQFKGNVKFVFQPNEEVTGAMDMIDAGVLADPKVDAAFGIHLWSPLKSGQIGLANGPVMAANEEFEITILGKPGHTSAPQEGVDPIIIASTIIQTLQSIQTRETDVLTPTSIVFGRIKGGTARNIVTEKVEMGGTIRFLYENEESGKKELLGKVERLVKGICAAMRAEYEIKFIPSNPAVMNHPEIVELVRVSVKETYGNEGTIVPYMCMGGDDFAYFTQKVPSTYCFLGIGSKDKGSNYPHHHPRFDIDEDILAYGTEVHIRTALRFLNR